MYYTIDTFLINVSCGCSVCMGFFFFKQKTAYEMRISDWSSDVCSSDLQGDDPRRIALLAGLGGSLRGIEGGGCRRGRQSRGVRKAVLDQIGRASCRERVCQYV